MSTRSTIAIKEGDNYYAIYCHYDGDSIGATLRQHHNSFTEAKALIELGSLSYIEDTTVCAYHRDKNDPWHKCKPEKLQDEKELFDLTVSHCAQYIYTYKDNQWITRKL